MQTALKLLFCVICAFVMSCAGRQEPVVTPWGEVISDSVSDDGCFDLDDVVANGEMIALTLNGPESYYLYHGKPLGVQYMMCQKFADHINVMLRMEVCRDTLEMLRRLISGDADMIACRLPRKGLAISADSLGMLEFTNVGDSTGYWVMRKENDEMVREVNKWYKPTMPAEVKKEETYLLGAGSVKRRVFSPMLDRKGGIISRYDHLFMKHSRAIRWDWKLMAAQCYQESTFDPNAKSWAGACGLMQIMPGTADMLGLPRSKMFDPESNIEAAARFLGQLDRKFSDIGDRQERISFILAGYNGGPHHVRDAMALARRDGHNASRWREVAPYILKLSDPKYYRDPIVKNGYMRGSETVDYVDKIRSRWASYRGVRTARVGASQVIEPQRAKRHKKKYTVE